MRKKEKDQNNKEVSKPCTANEFDKKLDAMLSKFGITAKKMSESNTDVHSQFEVKMIPTPAKKQDK